VLVLICSSGEYSASINKRLTHADLQCQCLLRHHQEALLDISNITAEWPRDSGKRMGRVCTALNWTIYDALLPSFIDIYATGERH
jgi:hypothetical protein